MGSQGKFISPDAYRVRAGLDVPPPPPGNCDARAAAAASGTKANKGTTSPALPHSRPESSRALGRAALGRGLLAMRRVVAAGATPRGGTTTCAPAGTTTTKRGCAWAPPICNPNAIVMAKMHRMSCIEAQARPQGKYQLRL